MNVTSESSWLMALAVLVLAAATALGIVPSRAAAACPGMFLDGLAPETPTPAATGAVLLCRHDLAALVSPETRDPIWSAEHLTTGQIMAAGMVRRHCRFQSDLELEPGARAEFDDYRHSRWDRGHMAPDADMPDDVVQRESCALAKAVPQAPRLNRGKWARIEEEGRRGTLFHGDVYVVTGPGFSASPASIGPDRVHVPDCTWKAIYVSAIGLAEAHSLILSQCALRPSGLMLQTPAEVNISGDGPEWTTICVRWLREHFTFRHLQTWVIPTFRAACPGLLTVASAHS